jgi:hypothetical protein
LLLRRARQSVRQQKHSRIHSSNDQEQWDGNVVTNQDGKIRGCSIQLQEGSLVDWTVTIDGEQADLGRFSQAIYKKIVDDAKQQRFQGFRPGTIPPQLESTYRAFAMDECARETVLEALQQNNIKPFEGCRQDMSIENVRIPAVMAKSGSKNKKKRKKSPTADPSTSNNTTEEPTETPPWRTFATMKEAIDAGWRPGQSFSFLAGNVKGQKLAAADATSGTSILPFEQ